MEAAFCSAERVTLAGSMIPFFTRSHHSMACASKPKPFFSFFARSTTIEPSIPAFCAIWRRGSSRARFTIMKPTFTSW